MLLSTLSIVPLFSTSVFARAHGILKRQSGQNGQDGPLDAGTAADCTYYDTALNNNYDCAYFENEWGVSHEDFVSYNPAVKEDCSGIKVGNSYCIEVNNGQPRPSSTIVSGGNTPTAAPAPSPTQDGLIGSCTKFYFAKKGDNCDKIVASLGGTVSSSDFITWNPAVGDDCSGLWADTYYCIAIPGTPTAAPTTAVSTSKPPTATAPSPTQDGLISTCTSFYKTVKGDYCGKIVDAYGTFTIAQFTQWNPAVGEDCSGLWADTYYCVGVPGTPTVRPTSSAPATTTLTGPSPTQDGIVSTCSRYHKVVSGDTCAKIQTQYGTFSLTQFLNWNPAVGTDCSGLWLGYYYCIGLPSTPTTKPTTIIITTTKAPTPTPTGPSPTQNGIISTCQRFHLAVSGDTCAKIQTKYATFSLTQFLSWNPAVGRDCSSLWLGYYYCIGVPGTPTVKPTTSTAKPTTSAAAPTRCTAAAPTPTQPGAICACKKWHQVVSGNTCAAIQTRYSISAANFNRWNPQVGTNCSSLWLGYNVCVSV